MNKLNITKHPIDRTALIAGIMFTFAGLAYLVDDHGLINVTEGAVAGTVVIVIGLVLLLAAVIDSPEVPQLAGETATDLAAEASVDTADFSWAASAPPAPEAPAMFGDVSEPDIASDESTVEYLDEAE